MSGQRRGVHIIEKSNAFEQTNQNFYSTYTTFMTNNGCEPCKINWITLDNIFISLIRI